MEKKLNLLGIRKKVILCHTKSLAGVTYTVMRPITEEDEQNLDKWECINVDGKRIDKKDIYCYGEINLSSNDDVEYIKKFSLLDTDNGGTVHSNFNYQEGYALVRISKWSITNNFTTTYTNSSKSIYTKNRM